MPPASRPEGFELLGLQQLRLRRLAGGDVHDRREHLQATVRCKGCKADLDRELGAVLAPAGQVEADSHRSGIRVRQEPRPMLDVARGDLVAEQDLHRLAEELGRLIPEGPCHVWIGIGDRAGRVDGHDRVRRCLQHGPETKLARGQRGLGSAPRGDVDDGRIDLDPGLRLHGGQADLGRELRAVAAPSCELSSDAHRTSHRMVHERRALASVAGGQRTCHQDLDGPTDQLIAAIAEVLEEPRIDIDDVSIRIGPDDRIR